MKPFLKWAGGKRQLHQFILPIIRKNLSHDNKYYEPFVGAGSVFLELAHPNTIINDMNYELMLCYNVIKEKSDDLISLLDKYKKNHSKDFFYSIRGQDRDLNIFNQLSDVERATRLIYLNKTCFNGLYRVNSKGQFNTPLGSYKNPKIYDSENITEISKYLNNQNIIIRNIDFEKSVGDALSGDFIYFDPPYDYEEKGFANYQKEGFDHFDLERLKKTCDELINRGCHVLISNHATKKVVKLFSDKNYELININYKINYVEAKRSIGSKIEFRQNAQEVLIHGYKK